jgi:hypothetical protein
MTTFYCLRFETSPGPRVYIPQEEGDPVIPPGTGFRLHMGSPEWIAPIFFLEYYQTSALFFYNHFARTE